MERRRSRRAIGFLIVCLWTMIAWVSIPFLPSAEARFAVSVWGAAVSAAGVVLAIYCIWIRKDL